MIQKRTLQCEDRIVSAANQAKAIASLILFYDYFMESSEIVLQHPLTWFILIVLAFAVPSFKSSWWQVLLNRKLNGVFFKYFIRLCCDGRNEAWVQASPCRWCVWPRHSHADALVLCYINALYSPSPSETKKKRNKYKCHVCILIDLLVYYYNISWSWRTTTMRSIFSPQPTNLAEGYCYPPFRPSVRPLTFEMQ